MEELWKLVQDKERIIESQRDEIDGLKAEVYQLRDEKEELMKKMTNLTLHDRWDIFIAIDQSHLVYNNNKIINSNNQPDVMLPDY